MTATSSAREAVADERRRARRLRAVVDLVVAVLQQDSLSGREAEEIVAHARRQALMLFAGREKVFDLVLAPRFARILRERYGTDQPGNVVLFRRPTGSAWCKRS